ncbi:RasGEF domain-containing protein [Legionella worsleiensis]|uniref:RasGEF domain protein n=1 Tax=Legionella worsleiensis TaxID=45076 RepID=A0A0W1A6M3_9GAMM|nr:RasGEF domain-containing protein [Legionella worsleiensis]KTD76989.1 RasGEF domain protein [Legionella worsleiensis]STY33338.1 RasGEF domain [Legionella worsleiensis]
MPSNVFLEWLSQRGNLQFLFDPLCSEQLDKAIVSTSVQKSIAGSKKNQALYGYIENRIVTDYATLIDFKLREAFVRLTQEDFKDPKGFECKDKSSAHQNKYFTLRNELEYFLKKDILQHQDSPDAKLNAFRRWIEIADVLLSRHCYEGFLLVFTNLQLIASPDLVRGLPQNIQNSYNELCHLNSPSKNHLALRSFIKNRTNEADFSPLILIYHAIAMINESIVHIREQDIVLKSRKKQVRREISRLQKELDDDSTFRDLFQCVDHHQSVPGDLVSGNRYLISLLQENKRISKDLEQNQEILSEQVKQRSDLLDTITKQQQYKPRPLSSHLEKSYHLIHCRYYKHNRDLKMGLISDERFSQAYSLPSRLYSESLLPSFWNRRGSSAEDHWRAMMKPSCLEPAQ